VTWLLDLDGVVWLTGAPIPGAARAIDRLRRGGEKVVYFTNNSGPRLAEHLDQLAAAGVTAAPGELLTSAQAAALLLDGGSKAAVVGGPGIDEALMERGVSIVGAGEHPDAVVVGRTTTFTYDELAEASGAIAAGARFVATNTDATLPTPDGPVPGAGAIVAFLAAASGKGPEVAGKPHQPSVELVAARVGAVDVVVGDRPETDGAFGRALGSKFVLVLSGVTRESDLPVEPTPDLVAPDLAQAVDRLTAG
jgi:HAD superfamily hydrolase (TIGR01450 family)